MNTQKQPILQIPETVRQDVSAYPEHVEKFLSGETSPVSFRAYRVPMGIYEQRESGKYMVRIRIGAGLVLPFQLERIAELSKTWGNGIVHVTTRQDIQIHEVDIENTPRVLNGLLEVGLSARGGGGNTVRNVTACPRAGICPNENFDVAPYAIAAAEYLLQNRSSFNLPRKYKIVFSGCSNDCAFASVGDLGFFAHVEDGNKGFAVYAAGGLGSNPAVAEKIEDFIPAEEILEVAEAIKRLFDKHGDRSNKNKARLRYVLRRTGVEEFVKLYNQERAEIREQGLQGHIPEIRDIGPASEVSDSSAATDDGRLPANVTPEKAAGQFTVCLRLKHGDISADDLIKVAQIAEKFSPGAVRTTQLQDLLLTSIAREDIENVNLAFNDLSIDLVGGAKPTIVTCTGAATCKLGLCLSRGLADAIADELKAGSTSNGCGRTIRISGCPNSCGHHFIADIGFQGRAKRVNGRLMPCYDVLVGAEVSEGRARLAETLATVPAKRIPQFIAELFSEATIEKDRVDSLLTRYTNVVSEPLPDEYYCDYGADEPFSLEGRGPGECGAGVMDVIKVDIDEAEQAMALAPKAAPGPETSEALYKAIVAASRALLITFALEPKKDREVFAAFKHLLIEPGWVKKETEQLIDEAIDWRMGERALLDDLAVQAEELVERIRELFLSLDAGLKFKAEPIDQQADAADDKDKTHSIDLRGIACPLNFVKAKLALEQIDAGDVLEMLLDDGEPVRNVPASFAERGHDVLDVENNGDHYCVKVRKKK